MGRFWCFYGDVCGKVDWGYCDCRYGLVWFCGGKNEFEGIVEVYVSGVWGIVCSSYWDDFDVLVICY